MKHTNYLFPLLALALHIGYSQAPVLTTEQVSTVLQFHITDQFPEYPLPGLRVYPDGAHYALRLDIQLEKSTASAVLLNLFDAIDNVCQYARDTITVYTVIAHWNDGSLPTIFAAEAACTAAFFRDHSLSEREWLGTCLMRRESLTPLSSTSSEKP